MTDDFRTQLIDGLTSGLSRQALMQRLLEQADVDERVRELLTQYLTRYADSEEEQRAQSEEAEERIRRLTEMLEDLSGKLKRVYAEVEELRQEKQELTSQFTALQDRHEMLAAALGVCPDCLGEDRTCSTCGGQGFPGSGYFESPDDLFWQFVAPAVQAKRSPRQRRRSNGAARP